MHGDFSRRTFSAGNGYRAVLLQQGRVLLDADVNEQAEITAHHDEVRTRDVVGPSGGPAPGPGEPGPFAVVGSGSSPGNQWSFSGEGWRDLRITPGRYYVDGVLVEGDAATPDGWALGDQPHLGVITVEGDEDPGLPEPTEAGRYLAYLDVWQRQVTSDEDPALLEAALGGPDTTTRARAAWQVRLQRIERDELRCRSFHARGVPAPPHRRMVAELAAPPAATDPCRISLAGGYQRLENQLYRVQVHDGPDPGSATAPEGTFLWSRENGSVVARVTDMEDGAEVGTAVLGLDRVGRDEELSFRAGQLVELTSTDWELRGRPGFLAAAGPADGLQLRVTWRDRVPGSLAALGRTPILRRWEGGPTRIGAEATDLEGGIRVRFPEGGHPRTGDHWLVPARAVRLVYGLTQVSGTIEWPPGGRGNAEQLPAGPEHHLAPLAVLVRTEGPEGTWSLEADCRRLFPSLTGPALDLVGGDGQEAMPGDDLPEPIRVAVRRGGRPVAGAPVRFTADDGGTVTPSLPSVDTGPDGVAQVRWRLHPGEPAPGAPAPSTQTLTIRLLDDHGDPAGSPVVVTGRLSVARQVAWEPPRCERFRDSSTVQDALQRVIGTREIRLLGGDGQAVSARGDVVPRPVRVVVDDGCGPVEGATVTAYGNPHLLEQEDPAAGTELGLVAGAQGGGPTPATLAGPDAQPKAMVVTGRDGVAAFWWQPDFGGRRWSTLDVVLDDSGSAPIRVTAGLDAGSVRRTPGVHITRLQWGLEVRPDAPFLNDARVDVEDLVSGIRVTLDGRVVDRTVEGKPVVRVLLDLPWPINPESAAWGAKGPIGFSSVEVGARSRVERDEQPDRDVILWQPATDAVTWLRESLFRVLEAHGVTSVIGRFVIDGWAIVSRDDPRSHLNGHADAVVEEGRTHLRLPTDDEHAGGQFVQWFRLVPPEGPVVPVPPVIGQPQAVARREIESIGLEPVVTTEPSALPRGRVVRIDPAPGTPVAAGSTVTLVVSSRRIR